MQVDTASKKRILFVDDEPEILTSLRNLLYKERARWDMALANDGPSALKLLRERTFDVVVSDMRMPGMDGAELLTQIKSEFPMVARIMLSGHADPEAIMRALPALHQVLAKPCEREALRSAIARGCEDSLDASLRSAIGMVDRLPSTAQLADAIDHPGARLGDVVAVVQRDPGLAAKVLQLVNSPYFGGNQRTSSIENAVARLGLDRLRYIALTSSLFAAVEADPIPELPLADMGLMGTRVAELVASIMGDTGPAFSAGLLHDVGQMLLASTLTDRYREVVARWKECGGAIASHEQDVLGATHADVGAKLLALWGLPDEIVDVVRFHHTPDLAPPAVRTMACAVHVADAVAEGSGKIDRAALERAGMLDQVDGWIAKLTSR